jgi:hypothetical protein
VKTTKKASQEALFETYAASVPRRSITIWKRAALVRTEESGVVPTIIVTDAAIFNPISRPRYVNRASNVGALISS